MNNKYFMFTGYPEMINGNYLQSGLNIIEEHRYFSFKGFIVFDAKNIPKYHFAYYLREVVLPKTLPGFKIEKSGKQFHTNMVFLSNIYELYDPKTMEMLHSLGFDPGDKSLNEWSQYYGSLYLSHDKKDTLHKYYLKKKGEVEKLIIPKYNNNISSVDNNFVLDTNNRDATMSKKDYKKYLDSMDVNSLKEEFKIYLSGAIDSDHINVAIELIKKYGFNSLVIICAVNKNYLKLIKYLLINKYCSLNEVIIISLENSQMDIFNYLKKFIPDLRPYLNLAILNNNVDIVMEILEQTGDYHKSFLLAAENCKFEIVSSIFERWLPHFCNSDIDLALTLIKQRISSLVSDSEMNIDVEQELNMIDLLENIKLIISG
ncbi:ankyrin repeat protein [Acanthamoeba polyphaga moumouvirus]|uniref:Ankyrin repeat protein n=1 Tax=Acanthamoeba polyphaga moumouvirus TaxID=1269028 RepID=L7RDG4_9VIRU|nr:ankyrin repeat protein [Acanthamoeba polyphaga moumouvirus]AGC02331.1 ankyrin repeat protein [Acanthamoeba polyphaga moumouvirus]